MMAYLNNSTRLLPNSTTEDPTASASSDGEDGTPKVWFKPTTSLNPAALQH